MKRHIATCIASTCMLLAAAAAPANAQDIRDQMEIKIGVAELVVPNMQPQEVATKVKEAISQWSIPASLNYRTMPSVIPAYPDEPLQKQIYMHGQPAIEYQCQTAYAEITKLPPPVKNAFVYMQERTQACLYRFEKGVKVYLIFSRGKRTESMTSGIFGGITKAIQGTDGERITKQLKESIEDIRKGIPSLLVARLEVPEMPVEEPDKAAVAALIPEKPATPQPAPQNATAATPQTSSAFSGGNRLQVKIEARKNLNAMGMTYHSQEQFITAIRRKDDVAVQLFLDGGGIDAAAKDANGKTPADIANEAGSVDIAKLITERLAPAAAAPLAPPKLATPPFFPETGGLRKMQKPIPPELMAKINAQIEATNATSEQKEAMRAQAIQQIQQIQGMVDRGNPSNGNLSTN